ncbi:hypothetical protein [Paractinoplanes rishiriensis]|uniref:Uncharacterized protein n=1 Tax=Paractinoplanes rishiriensis TaxID=1050105 RepID=A0A919K2N8_9ACTN|nr:hypothetical protein Ari01nite_49830 [Actinoplanes rishiriensis]
MSVAIRVVAAGAAAALAVRVVRSRRRRFLHPAGRSFEAEFEFEAGLESRAGFESGAGFEFEAGGRYPATVRVSKGAGTRGGRLDVRGLAIRVHLPEGDLDLLLSTSGTGPLTRHLPAPRRTFDTFYGSITAYRIGGRKVYLTATGVGAGDSLAGLAEEDSFRLGMLRDDIELPFGRVRLGAALPADADAGLAFNPVLNSLPELHPTGLIHGVRAFAYRASQRWRRVPSFELSRQGARRT